MALKLEQILVDPFVKVTVVEYHSRPISVMGAVHKPVTFQSVGKVTLLDALARAEGLTQRRGHRNARHARRIGGADSREKADEGCRPVLKLRTAWRRGDSRSGSRKDLRRRQRAQARGVLRCAMRAMSPCSGWSRCRKGLLPYAAKEAYIYRRDEKGAKQEIPVALEKIMQRKSPDVTLETDDVFYVPDNKTRADHVTVIDRITAFGSSTASGLLDLALIMKN